jgi:hypothetical protein
MTRGSILGSAVAVALLVFVPKLARASDNIVISDGWENLGWTLGSGSGVDQGVGNARTGSNNGWVWGSSGWNGQHKDFSVSNVVTGNACTATAYINDVSGFGNNDGWFSVSDTSWNLFSGAWNTGFSCNSSPESSEVHLVHNNTSGCNGGLGQGEVVLSSTYTAISFQFWPPASSGTWRVQFGTWGQGSGAGFRIDDLTVVCYTD